MIEGDGAFEIAAVAGTAEDAIDALQQVRVDIILLDLEMPGAGGLKSIPRIIAAAAGAKVMIVSSQAEDGAEETVAAHGARCGRYVAQAGHRPVQRPLLGDLARQAQGAWPCSRNGRAAAVPAYVLADAAAADAGGPHRHRRHRCIDGWDSCAWRAFSGASKTDRRTDPHYCSTCRHHSCRCSPASSAISARRPVFVAEDGMKLADDEILLAPGDAHLTLDIEGDDVVVRLTHGRASSGCMPSVDPMLASLAAIYGPRALGVVLTGMGRDGVEGAARVVARGGSVIAQDEKSWAVWGCRARSWRRAWPARRCRLTRSLAGSRLVPRSSRADKRTAPAASSPAFSRPAPASN